MSTTDERCMEFLKEMEKRGLTLTDLIHLLESLLENQKANTSDDLEKSYRRKVCKVLRNFNIPIGINGYRYLIECILLVHKMNTDDFSIIKDVYQVIGNKHEIVPLSVGKSIDYALKSTWEKADAKLKEEIFGSSVKYCPSNKQFIIGVVEYIRNQ